MDAMTGEEGLALVEALAKAVNSLVDIGNGYPDKELHEPPEDTVARGRALCERYGWNFD